MNNLSAAERRFHENATLIGAQRILFSRLAELGSPMLKLSEIADTASGGTPDRGTSSFFGGSHPWLKSGELNDGTVTEIEESITDSGLENSNAKVFPSGTLLIALYGATVGKTGILGIAAATNQAVCAVMPKRGDVRAAYLHWFLRHKREDFLQNSFGGAQPNISQRILRDTLLPLPPPDIQEAVSTFLQAVQRRMRDRSSPLPDLPTAFAEQRRVVSRIEELAAKCAEARLLRSQGVEQAGRLLATVAARVFAENSYKTEPLGSLAEKRTGVAYKAEDFSTSGRIPVVRLKEIQTKSPSIYLRNTEKYPNVWLEPGDIILAKTSFSTGAMCIWPGPRAVLNQNAIMLRANPELEQRFLFFWLQHQVSEFLQRQLADPHFYPYIRESDIVAWKVPVPPLAEQRRIVAHLDELQIKVKAMMELQSETATELDALMPSILDKAFRGEL